MNAHHFFASSGEISGVGFAKAKIIGLVFIVSISFEVRIFHLLAHMKMSAQIRASFIVQEISSLLYAKISFLYSFKSLRDVDIIPFESEKIIFFAQASRKSFHIAIAAAPAHEITIF
jgi:hypothetical protein